MELGDGKSGARGKSKKVGIVELWLKLRNKAGKALAKRHQHSHKDWREKLLARYEVNAKKLGEQVRNIVKNSSKAGPRIASLPNVFKAFRKKGSRGKATCPKSGPCVSLTKGFKPKIAKAKKGARGKKAYGNFKRRWNFGQWGLGDKKWAGIRHTGYLNIEGNTEKLEYHLHSSMPVDFFTKSHHSTRLTSKLVPRSDSSLTPRSPSARLVIGATIYPQLFNFDGRE